MANLNDSKAECAACQPQELTDEQVENWRRALGMVGRLMSREQIQAHRDAIQAMVGKETTQ